MLKHLRLLTALVVLLLTSVVAAPAIQADDLCDTVVVDATAEKVLGDTSAINDAITQLSNLGADVRVRAFQSVNDAGVGGSLDAYRDKMVANCPSWSSQDSYLKGNMLLYLMSMDHKSAIFYGSNWRDELDDSVDYIRGTVMGDKFRSGDFGGGFVQAMDATYNAISTPDGSTSQSSGESFGNTTFGVVFVWLLVGITVVALVIFAAVIMVKTIGKYRTRKQALAEAKAAAIETHRTAIDALSTLSELEDTVKLDVELIKGDLNPDDAAEIDALYEQFTTNVNKAYVLNGELSNSGEYDPNQSHSIGDYELITDNYSHISDYVQSARSLADQLSEMINRLRSEMAAAPQRVDDITRMLTGAEAKHQHDETDGYKPLARTKLEKAKALVADANANIANKRAGYAIGNLDDAEQLISEDVEALTTAQAMRDEIRVKVSDLQGVEQYALQVLDSAPAIVKQLQTAYPQKYADDVSRRVERLRDKLHEAANHLREIERDSSMDMQNWENAKRAIKQQRKVFNDIKDEATDIAASYTSLESMLSSIPDRVKGLHGTIDSAIGTISSLRGDQTAYLSKLEQLKRALDKINIVPPQGKPDPRELDDDLVKTSDQVDRVFDEAQDIDREIREREEEERREEERKRRQREEEARRRREEEDRRSSSFAIGYGIGSSSSSSSWDSGSFGGGSSGGWGGSSGGGSSGSW